MTDITVTTIADTLDDTDGVTSLREALLMADAGPDADRIVFDASLAGETVTLGGEELALTGSVTIDGDIDGDGIGDIVIDGGGESRVFHATGGTNALNALTVTGGDATSGGGLRIDRGASVAVTNTGFDGNVAQFGGGAIENFGDLTVENATFADNGANTGGGIFTVGTATLTNVTFAGNTAQLGGGIANFDTLSVAHGTLTGNTADTGGGIASFGAAMVTNSIVLGNGTETFGNVAATDSLLSGDAQAVFAAVADGAGVLADNGGAVRTVALSDDEANAALDAGDAATVPAGDGRGFARTDRADLGAFELGGRDPNAPFLSIIALTAATDTGASDADGITANRRPGITFEAGDGDTLEIDWNDGNGFRAVGNGTGGLRTLNKPEPYPSGEDGPREIVVRSTKNGQVDTQTLTITIDTTAPDVPVPTLDAASDTGAFDDDRITSETEITLTGTGEANMAVEVLEGDTVIGTATADGTGAWSLETTALSEGAHDLVARYTDIAGNNGTSRPLTVTVDTDAPDAPTIVDFGADTGVVGDGLTGDSTPTLNGTADAGTEIRVFDGETLLGTTHADDRGAWSMTTPVLADGTHELTARSVDAAGNLSAFGALTVEIDTTAPGTPIIDGFGEDTGIAGDGITADPVLTLTGTTVPGGTVELFDGETSLGTATADDRGAWSLTTGTLADGHHAITAQLSDAAGNVATSDVLAVEIDTEAPDAPGIGGFGDDKAAQDGGTTPNPVQTLSGTGEPGGTVDIFDGDTLLTTVAIGDDGKWQATTPTLADGPHTLTAQVTDAGGNVSDASAPRSFTVDASAPVVVVDDGADRTNVLADAPVLLTFDEPVTVGAGRIVISDAAGNDIRTIDVPSDAVVLSDDGLTLSVDPGADLADGTEYTVSLDAGIVADAVGNASAAVDAFDFTTRPVEAAGLIVTTATDVVDRFDGLTSLREAVALANSDADASTITFDAALDGETLVLEDGDLILSGDTTIDGDVDGDETADITVDGAGKTRVFNATDGTVAIESLVVTGGDAGTGVGGGLRIGERASVAISDSVFDGNDARIGGGIYNGGTLTVSGSLLTDNDARLGGGLHNDGLATVAGTTLAGNTARVGGGAANSGILDLTGSTVSGNTARSDGGISNEGVLTATNAIVLGNAAPVDAEIGTDAAGLTTIVSSVISGDAGGVFAALDADGAGVLGDNGASVQTIGLLGDFRNPALDIGAAVDAAGAARTVDLDGVDNGGTIDAGAQELAVADAPLVLSGTEERDRLVGQDTNDLLQGLGGNDVLLGGYGADSLDGGDGSDRVDYAPSDVGVTVDLAAGTGLFGTAEGDTIVNVEGVLGTRHADTIIGDDAANALSGRAGDDTLIGGGGNDALLGGTGADSIDGGAGKDRVDYRSATVGMTVDLAAGTASDGDTIVNVERIAGSQYADVLIGDAGVNDLLGAAGNDSLDGGAGDDIVRGNGGADTLSGGEGDDGLLGGSGDDALDGGSGNDLLRGDDGGDVLTGGDGNDFLRGDDGDDVLAGGDGADILRGGAGADSIDGGAGSDRIDYADSAVGVTVDLAAGTASDGDTITGIERVLGSAQDDTLTGDSQRNILDGGAGDDTLSGGGDNDMLMGGAGADSFVFTNGGSVDTVDDFEDGIDLLVIETAAPASFADLDIRASGTDTIVDLDDIRIILADIDMASVDADDFQFVTL